MTGRLKKQEAAHKSETLTRGADLPIDGTPKRGLRGFRSQGCAKRTAFRGDRFAVVLEFESSQAK
jgi:hypothetical protein